MSDTERILVELYWHNDTLHTFVVRPNRAAPELFSVPVSGQRLKEYINSFHVAFAHNDADEREYGSWTELGRSWLQPVLGKEITESSHVIFIPHGVFHNLPLHLLTFREKPLVMTCPVSYSPSSSLLVECRRLSRSIFARSKQLQLLAVGVEFEEEARMVHASVGKSSLWLDSDTPVDKAALLSRWGHFQWLHFSCHGIFDIDDPMQSGVVLYRNDGKGLSLAEVRQQSARYLTAAEISRSRLSAALVTLSACETAQTTSLPGDEILGLTRAFLLAGAAAVMVSFWPVPAPSTQEFMRSFYQQLASKRLSLASAARCAYLSTAKLYPDSFSWGGFALIGDGLTTWTLS